MEKVLPVILIILDLGAAAGYLACKGDHARTLYWLSAAAITASVTFADSINEFFGKL